MTWQPRRPHQRAAGPQPNREAGQYAGARHERRAPSREQRKRRGAPRQHRLDMFLAPTLTFRDVGTPLFKFA